MLTVSWVRSSSTHLPQAARMERAGPDCLARMARRELVTAREEGVTPAGARGEGREHWVDAGGALAAFRSASVHSSS